MIDKKTLGEMAWRKAQSKIMCVLFTWDYQKLGAPNIDKLVRLTSMGRKTVVGHYKFCEKKINEINQKEQDRIDEIKRKDEDRKQQIIKAVAEWRLKEEREKNKNSEDEWGF